MTLFKVTLAVTAATLLAGHVAPSVDDNNRYIKVTPLRGAFRLAYTVFFGEIPGASERQKLDTNRDGRIDQPEASAFGTRIALQVADSLEVEIGGVPQRVQWAVTDVGLGSDAVAAGSFSIDMIAYVCAPAGRIRVRDRFRIPRPGETEVKIEDSPGVTISRARIGGASDPQRDYRFVGHGGPLTDEGIELEWTATPSAPEPPLKCGAARSPAATSSGPSYWLLVLVVAGMGVVAAGWHLLRRWLRPS